MALKKFIFINTSGAWQEEQGASDGLQLPSLVIGAGSESVGNITLSSTGKIINLVDGTSPQDAVTKAQLDAAISGLHWKHPVQVLRMKSDVARTPTGAIIEGSGGTWGGNLTTGDKFTVSIDGETPVLITLTSAPADVAATITAINSLYATGGGTGGTIAVDGGSGQIDIKSNTTGTGSTVAITLADSVWGTEVGISNGTDAGTNDVPTAGSIGEAWVVNSWGTGYNDGDIVEWDGDSWNIVTANVGDEPPDGTHVIVIESGAAGSFAGKAKYFAVYNAGTNTWTFTAPASNDAVLIDGETSVYHTFGYVYDTTLGWVAFSGPASIPDATSASGGGTKGKVTFDSDKGLVVSAGVASVKLTAAGTGVGGLEFDGSGYIQAKVNATGAIGRTTSGLEVLVDGTTIDINGSNELTVIGAGDAERVSYNFTGGAGGITAKYPVYVSGNNTVLHATAGSDSAFKVIGVAPLAISAGNSGEVVFSGYLADVLTTATAGTAYYLGASGGLTTSVPAAGNHLVRMGYAANETDLVIQIAYLGKRAAP